MSLVGDGGCGCSSRWWPTSLNDACSDVDDAWINRSSQRIVIFQLGCGAVRPQSSARSPPPPPAGDDDDDDDGDMLDAVDSSIHGLSRKTSGQKSLTKGRIAGAEFSRRRKFIATPAWRIITSAACRYWRFNAPFCSEHRSRDCQCFWMGRTIPKIAPSPRGIWTVRRKELNTMVTGVVFQRPTYFVATWTY